MKIDKNYIVDFLNNNPLAILSTINKNGLIDSAPIYYITNKDLSFNFITPEKTQKAINISQKNEVLLTIVNEEKQETVQIRGKAEEDPSALESVLEKLINKLSVDLRFVSSLPLLKFKDQRKYAVLIKPYEIRFRKFNEDKFEEKIIKLT